MPASTRYRYVLGQEEKKEEEGERWLRAGRIRLKKSPGSYQRGTGNLAGADALDHRRARTRRRTARAICYASEGRSRETAAAEWR